VPALTSDAKISGGTYQMILLMHVGIIAFAGVVANLRLVQLLRQLSGNAAAGRRVLLAWLAGNLFLGSQLSWICRPFIGSPGLQVQFLRDNAFEGNFYETVFRVAWNVMSLD
jgi:predicted membrane-bound spermidine synthase